MLSAFEQQPVISRAAAIRQFVAEALKRRKLIADSSG
jgi:hypothetical protein